MFLSGNHDNYLRHDAEYGKDSPRFRKVVFELLGATRERNWNQERVFMEHGHWLDASNMDGAAPCAGHAVTQQVFKKVPPRSFDPERRKIWIVAASLRYLENFDRDHFQLYVMAHTQPVPL